MNSRSRALVLGYGFTGRAIGQELKDRGLHVTGVRRTWPEEREQGDPDRRCRGDITEPRFLESLDDSYDLVVNAVSAGKRGDPERYRSVYLKGARNLVEWLRSDPPRLVLYTGSAGVFERTDGSWVRETDSPRPGSACGRVLLQTEEIYREAHRQGKLPASVLRLTGIYGPGRCRLVDRYREGSWQLPPPERDRYMNIVHRDDIARVVAELWDQQWRGEVLHVTDSEPVLSRVYARWLSKRLNRPMPPTRNFDSGRDRKRSHKRVSNERLIEEVGVELQYPNFREGLEPLL